MVVGKSEAAAPLYSRLVVALPAGIFAWLLGMVPTVSRGGEHYWELEWLPQLGISLSFRVDGLALLFGLLIAGIGTLILLYASEYMRGVRHTGRFTIFLVAFMLSMLGVVLTDNLIALFVFWELTTITSFLLIGHSHEDGTARRAALQGLIVTGAGALAMLAGFVLLAEAAGTYSLRKMLSGPVGLSGHPGYHAILALVLAGAFTKSAQFPFHFWLPNAMVAPTPVSAYLHSATMVKAGVFLLARLNPVLGNTDSWAMALTVTGAVTAVYSAAVALTRNDLKQILAYTTLMALGVCVMFLGLPAADDGHHAHLGPIAAVTFVFVHALYKAALFMAAGTIDHSAGTRDVRNLAGLRRSMPWTFGATAAAALSMAGLPPFIGFVGKELLYESAISSPVAAFVVAAVAAASSMIIAAAFLVSHGPFGGNLPGSLRHVQEGRWALWLGPVVLGFFALVAGLVPQSVFRSLLVPAAGSVIGDVPEYEAAVWHGLGPPLLLSFVTLGCGALLCRYAHPVRSALGRGLAGLPVTGDRAYDAFMEGIAQFSALHTRWLQSGIQRRYIWIAFATLGAGLAVTLALKDAVVLPAALPNVSFVDTVLALLVAASALVTVNAKTRLMAICSLGVVGAGISLIFLVHGAVDVAMTQLMVETLTVVIVAMVLLKLPGFENDVRQSVAGRWRDGIVSVLVGVTVTLMLLSVTTPPSSRPLSDYFVENAYPQGFGRNTVNVILVDFRGFDTLGEITVLLIAAVGATALIRWRVRRPLSASQATGGRPRGSAGPENIR